MTRKYLITKLIKNYFDSIVTLLDYDTQMTNQLKKITILSKKEWKSFNRCSFVFGIRSI